MWIFVFPGIGSQKKIDERNIPLNIQGKLKLLYHFIGTSIFTNMTTSLVTTCLYCSIYSMYNLWLLIDIQRLISYMRCTGRKKIRNFFFSRVGPFFFKKLKWCLWLFHCTIKLSLNILLNSLTSAFFYFSHNKTQKIKIFIICLENLCSCWLLF